MKIKKILAVILSLAMVLSSMSFTVFAEDADLTISTAEQLKTFAAAVNAGNSYEGKTVVLANDIDLEWSAVVIGRLSSPFKGTFDGQNYAVKNITIYEDGSESDYFTDSDDYLGLFGVINTPAVIKNVTVSDPFIVGRAYIGGIVGMGYTGTIENCHVTGEIDIEGFYMVGGINGHGYAKISNCSVVGDEDWDYSYIVATYKEKNLEGDNVGGIVGHNGEDNDIIGCEVANVTVSGTRKVGGIVGITAQNSDVKDCKVSNITVETTATAEYAADNAKTMSIGGLVGQYQKSGDNDGTISGCEVSGLTFANENGVKVSAGALSGGLRGTSDSTVAPSETVTASGNVVSDVVGATTSYLVPDVAKIGETGYSTLLEAFAAAKAGDTVELTGDLTLAPGDIDYRENIKIPEGVTFDGNNYTLIVEQTQDCDYGTFWSPGAYTIQNITIKVMGEREACRTIINVSKGGTIKNVKLWSTVLDIAINYDKPVNGMTLLVENCEISGSTYAFYCDPNASEIDVTLKDNVIDSQRFGSMQHDEHIVGNTLTESCSKGISLGASFTGVVEKNIFEGARALSVYGTQTISENVIGANSIVELNNGAVADLSGNYWGGDAPGEAQIVPDKATSVTSYTVESYYTTYEDGVLSDLVMIQTAVAKIGETEYATFEEALAAAQNGDTIVLVGDVEFTATTISVNKEIKIDGNGHKITTADTFIANGSNAMLDIMGGVTVTFNNVTFDGIKNCAIMRTVSANVVIDNCTVTNCEHTVAQGLFRLACGNATITDSKFIDNDCTMVISFGYDAANDTDVLTIDGCLFEGNTCGETAVVYFADGDYGTVKNTKFVDNNVSSNGNAATLYMGWGDGFEVSGCTFEGNNVTTTHATTKRFAGAIFCDGCVVKNNVFKNNTAIRNGETISTTVAVGAYFGAADVSENYWNDGSEPVIGEDYTVEYTRNPVENVSYYTTYEDGVLSDLVMIQTAVAQTMNANGEVVGSYTDFESAVAAACADETITRIEILSDFEQKNVVNTDNYYDVKQALTIGAPEGKKYTVTGAKFAIRIMGGSLTIAENVTIENLDIVANGFATSGDNMTINGTLKALSLKQWTSNGTITVNGNVWLGYGDGQFELAYGNGTVTVNGNGDKTTAQFTAGYSGTRGNGNTLNLKDTFFEAGAWFTMNGSNGTINVDNSVLNVNGGDFDTGFSISSSGNVINLTNGAELKARKLTVGANNTVNLGAGCSITVTQLNGAGKIVIDAAGMTAGSVAAINANASAFTGTIEVVNSNMTAEIDENGNIVLVEAVYPVAKIGDAEYATLAEAVAAAQTGDTIVVLDNIAVSDGIVIAADKTVVLDLNGYTVSREQTETATANSQLIKNLGTLTIKDSSEQKTGKLSYTYTGAQVAYSVSTISNNQATLTVESGTIENNTLIEYTGANGVYAYAIDSLTNGNLGEASVTVTGGTIKSDYMAIRQFVNSTTDNNILVVTDGEIVGGKRAINVQGSNTETKASNTAVLEISGGVVKAVSESGYSLCALSSSENMSVTGGTFVGTIYSGAMGIISGGTYNISPYEGYVAIGFEINENEDGTFGIVVGAPEIVQVTVSSDEPSQKLSVLVDVVNIPDDAKVYVASYNGNRMIEAKIVDKTDLSAVLSSVNVDAVKCFVWDVNSQPCCDSQQVSKGEFASK